MEYGPRRRESVVSLTAPSYRKRYDPSTGILVSSVQYPKDFAYHTSSNCMDDVVTENFHSLVRRGSIINNPCSKVDVEEDWNIPEWGFGNLYFPTETHINTPIYIDRVSFLGFSESALENAIQLASTRALSKVSSEEMLLGASLGELKETKELLVSACARLRHFGTLVNRYLDILSDPRKNSFDRAGQLIGTAKNAWMETRFGWRPFAGECGNLYTAIRRIEKFPQRQTFRATEMYHEEDSDYVVDYKTVYRQLQFHRKFSFSAKISAGVLAQQRYGGVPDTWGLTKIPQTIWELTKLSWAVDYFLNVGDLIAAYVPDSLWTPMCSWVSIRSELKQSVQVVGFLPNPVNKVHFVGGGKPTHTKITRKYVRSTMPPIGLAYRDNLGIAKYIDLVGLTRVDSQKWIKRVSKLTTKLKRRV